MEEYIKNPFNYIGAKYKLLSQILPLFPENITTFVDMFGGSGEVGINVQADKVDYYDKCEALVNILNNLDDNFIQEVENTISAWGLSKLGKQEYIRFREYYNNTLKMLSDRDKAVYIYSLLTHAFNYQLAFNSKGEYNMPSGYNRSYFSEPLKIKLQKYIEAIQSKNIQFYNKDFVDIDFNSYDKDTFFYVDPPYLITVGAYERDYNCKWSETYERKLYEILDNINDSGRKFALSNVLTHKGKTNEILQEWSAKYNIHHLVKEYANCNYQTNSSEIKVSDEVLITNY